MILNIKKQKSQIKMNVYDIDLDTGYLAEVFDSEYTDYLLNKLVNLARIRYVINERAVKMRIKFHLDENREEFLASLVSRFGNNWDVSYIDMDRLDCVFTIFPFTTDKQ